MLEKPIDHRTDIYALGATLYYLLTGKPPYDGDDAAKILMRQVYAPAPTLPGGDGELGRLLARMMAKAPEARHAGYNELVKDIDQLLSGETP